MATVNTDRNLLFGILALQMDFISRDALIVAMSAWAVAKTKLLGRILVEQSALTESRYTMLDALVEEHLKLHGNDPQRSLAAVSGIGSVRQDLEQIADADLHASLAHVPAAAPDHDANATRPPSMGVSTSTGLRFRVVRPHAKGGLGVVSVARDEELRREVALKEIQGEHADNPQSRARFVLEAEITGGLEHPGIVPVYGLGHDPTGRPFYAMRFIRGNSLREAIERFHHAEKPGRDPGERALALRELLGRFVDVCNAIAYAHSRGVLHRDLKPGNIMLGQYGETLVVDWGLAKPLDRSEESAQSAEGPLKPASGSGVAPTQMGSAVGTPQYMSPEQAAGRLDRLGPASDVYSLGATLYSLLTGRPAFEDPDPGAVLQKVQQGNFRSPRALQRQVAPALEAICLKAMALKPADRYATPKALADDVEHWLADEPVSAYREPWLARAGRWARRHKTLVAATAAGLLVALLAVGVGAWWLEKHRAEQQARQHETDQKARLALERARGLLDQGWQANDVAKLKEAKVEADGAAEIAHSGAGTEAVQADAAALQHEVQQRLARAEKNRTLLENLLNISAPQETRSYQGSTSGQVMALAQPSVDEQHAAAFRRRWDDLNLDETAEADVVKLLSAEPQPVVEEVLAGLDAWMQHRRQRQQPEAPWRRLWGVAEQLDRNDQRRGLRALLVGDSPPPVGMVLGLGGAGLPWTALWPADQSERWRRLVQLRRQVNVAREPVLSVVLLARASRAAGDSGGAEELLRQGVTVRPQAVVLLTTLANLLEERGRVEEAIGCYRAGRALRPQLGVRLGKALLQAGRGEEGETVLRDLLEQQPNNPELHFSLGYILGEQKKFVEAEAACRRAIALKPDYAEAYTNLGAALNDQKKVVEAEAAHRKAIALKPDFPMAYYNLGVLLGEQKKLVETEAGYRKAIEFKPDCPEAYNNLGIALHKQKKVVEAEVAFRKAIALKFDFPMAYYNLGILLDDQKRLPEAEAAYRKAIALKPDDPEAYNNLGVLLDDQKKLVEAEVAFRKAIALKPDYAKAYNSLGNALRQQKKLVEAEVAFRKAIALKPNDSKAYYKLGILLHEQKKLVEAEATFRKAIEFKPDCPEAYHYLGTLLHAQKKVVEAEAALRKAIALQPDFPEAYYNLGVLLVAQKKLVEAEAAYRKAIALKPNDPKAYTNLGAALDDQKKFVEAEAAYRKAITLQPDHPEAYIGLGIALREQKKLAEAEAAYRKAIALQPDYALAYNNLGNALRQQKKFVEAEATYRKAIALQPNDPKAYYNLGVFLREQKNLVEAEAAFRKADQLFPNYPLIQNNLRQAQRLLQLDRKLTACLSGKERPANPQEAADLAACAVFREHYHAATRFYADAFKDDPKLTDNLQLQHRYNAACSAALASAGQGKDAHGLSQPQRITLRRQACDWLHADRKAYSALLEKNKTAAADVQQRLTHWLDDTDLASVRDAAALAKLPVAERDAWRKLWSDVEALRKRIEEK